MVSSPPMLSFEKREELPVLAPQEKLPYLPGNKIQLSTERRDYKESDFIKRIKRAKSIMIAQKNRKQKNVLNAYFMENKKK